jgi:lambda repressor-like predicted transcriptional regulator
MNKLSNETEIKVRTMMWEKKITAAAIGRRCDRHRGAIHQTIKGIIKSRYCRQAIADALGVQVSDLWPDAKSKRAA